MIVLKIALTLCATLLGIQADVGPGQNAYLPPDKGYQYPKPPRPFPTPTRPSRPPPTIPGYTPTQTRPPPFTTPRPSYGPPISTPYRPPSVTPTRPGPTRPIPTIPSYRPTTPGYRPTTPGYRPTTPGYRPSPTPRPRPTGPPYDGQPSDGHDVHDHSHDHHHHHEPGMPFDFAYAVNDAEHGNDYSHNAISDGDITRGEYRIVLPDGRTQVVKYTADWKNGFNAQVSFEGNPTYPQFQGAGSNPQGSGYKY